ncbi:hypothetical protein NQ314_017983 [Rhamnusium bicolor]|uniref:RNA-directed DNA polymerase n=1 Tax=Rhamnusium bicolor TaxID=1586634 RepID=A0AAV8WSG4_9CUCU|nr:hypothetical protein NQ314_017983 [Rhamnusium bicolor]
MTRTSKLLLVTGRTGLKNEFAIDDGFLWRKTSEGKALVVPKKLIPLVLYEYHDSRLAGHPGRDETQDHVRLCIVCASIKRGAVQGQAPLRPRTATRPWQTISLDIMGPCITTKKGNRFLIVITDTYSKWTEAEAVPATDATHLRKALDACCHRWGFLEVIITDCAPLFRARSWERYMKQHNIQHCTTPIYHQRTNPVERRNQEIKKALRIKTAEDRQAKWDECMQEVLFNINNRLNASTGFTPSIALFGAPLVCPGEWAHPERQKPIPDQQKAAPGRARKIRARQVVFQRNLYPEPREANTTFQPGDEVMVRNY